MVGEGLWLVVGAVGGRGRAVGGRVGAWMVGEWLWVVVGGRGC